MTATCHICRRQGLRLIFSGPLEKFTRAMGRATGVDYYYCDKCTALSQHPIFDEAEYTKFYEKVQRSDETGFRSDAVPKTILKNKRLNTSFKLGRMRLLGLEAMLPGKRIFEIGTAEGTLLAHFRDRGYSVRGIEPLALYLRDVARRTPPRRHQWLLHGGSRGARAGRSGDFGQRARGRADSL